MGCVYLRTMAQVLPIYSFQIVSKPFYTQSFECYEIRFQTYLLELDKKKQCIWILFTRNNQKQIRHILLANIYCSNLMLAMSLAVEPQCYHNQIMSLALFPRDN